MVTCIQDTKVIFINLPTEGLLIADYWFYNPDLQELRGHFTRDSAPSYF